MNFQLQKPPNLLKDRMMLYGQVQTGHSYGRGIGMVLVRHPAGRLFYRVHS